MTIVGFDTSTAATSACVLRDDGRAFELIPPVDALMQPPAHAHELLPAVDALLVDAGVGYDDLDGVAVGAGPGTFTGLRIGFATARSIASSIDVDVHPVSSLAALAAGIGAPIALPVIDARRGEVFAALYRDGCEAIPAFVDSPEALAGRLGDGVTGVLAAGDGSLRFREVLEAAGVSVAPDESESHVVRAFHICQLATDLPAVRPEAALPTYLRAPDARPLR